MVKGRKGKERKGYHKGRRGTIIEEGPGFAAEYANI